MKKWILALFIFLNISSTLGHEFIGAPLAFYRQQKYNTCWAHTGFNVIQSAIQKDTGISYGFSIDKHFWFYIYRERLLARWKAQRSLQFGLDDKNIFTDMGITEEVFHVFTKYGLKAFYLQKNTSRVILEDIQYLKPRAIAEEVYYIPKKFDFKKLMENRTEENALLYIDKFLLESKFEPYLQDEFSVEGESFRLSEFKKLFSLDDPFVWVPVLTDKMDDDSLSYFPTGLSFEMLGISISEEEAQALVKESLLAATPVPLNANGHTTLIVAQEKNSYYEVDSRFEAEEKRKRVRRRPHSFPEHSAIHVKKSLLEKILRPKYTKTDK